MAKGASSATVDFGAIEDGGGSTRVRVPEGDYKVKVKKVEYTTSSAGNPMFKWTFIGTEGRLKGKELTDYTALTPKALWKLRDLLTALTGKAPGGAVDVRKLTDHCKKLVGQEFGVTLTDDEYTNDKGKTFISSKVDDYVSGDDLTGEAPEDDDVEDEDDADVESDDEDDDDALAGLDRAGLKALIKAESLEVKVTKSMSDDDIRTAIAAAQGDDDDDDEEEIEDVDLDEL